jgi:hypothetical protein
VSIYNKSRFILNVKYVKSRSVPENSSKISKKLKKTKNYNRHNNNKNDIHDDNIFFY